MPTSRRGWRTDRVLVTGATGFIGAHLVSRLRSLGAEVHAVSRAEQPDTGGIRWHTADLADPEATTNLLCSVRPSVVFHLASAVTGARQVNLVLPVLHANLASAVNLMTAAAEVAPRTRLVLAGSVEEPRDGTGDAPASPYAVAKWAASGYARMFHRLWDLPVSVLRVAMVYGPGQPDTAKLLPYATLSLLRGEDPQLSSGTRLVDWVYVDDVVDAFIATAESDAAVGEVFDIGSGQQVSIKDTVLLLAEIVGGSGQPRFGGVADRPLDYPQLADPQPAAKLLGWRPATTLSEGLRQTVAWYAKQV